MKKTILSFWILMIGLALARAQAVPVYFTNLTMIGTTNDTTITIKAVNNPVRFLGKIFTFPQRGTNITTINGVASIGLIPNKYTVVFAGIPQSFSISVTNSATALNAAALTTDITFYSGVETITGAGGITIYPPTGPGGNWIASNSATGGNGTGNVTGPNTSALNNIAIFDQLTGKSLGDSGIPISTIGKNHTTFSVVSGGTFATTTNLDGGTNFALTVTAAGTGTFNGPNSAVAGNFVTFNGTSGALGADSGKSSASFEAAGSVAAAQSLFNSQMMASNATYRAAFAPINGPFLGNATTATTAAQLENRGSTGPGGAQASISTSGNNGFNIADADGSTMGLTGGGISIIYSPNSALPPLQLRDTNNVTFAKITLSGFIGSGAGLSNLNASQLTSGTVAPARLGTGIANNTTFLRGDGQYATPSGSGNFNGPGSSTSGNFLSFNGTSGTVGQDSGVGPSSFDLAGAASTVNSGIQAQLIASNAAYVARFVSNNQASVTFGLVTITNGFYLNYFYADGSTLRSNTVPPYDWVSCATNAITKAGTNTVTKYSFNSISGVLTTSGSIVGSAFGNTGINFAVSTGGGISGTSLTAGTVNGTAITGGTLSLTGMENVNGLTNNGTSPASLYGDWNVGGALHVTNSITADQGANFGNSVFLSSGNVALSTGSFYGVDASMTGTVTATNGNFLTVTASNLNVSQIMTVGTMQVGQFQSTSNAFAGTVVHFNTNSLTVRTASDVGFTDVGDVPTGLEGWTVVHIIATADINVTNAVKLNASDFLTTRVLTNGTQFDVLFQVQKDQFTNSYFARTPHN